MKKKYYCNDCEGEEPHTGNCELTLPNITGVPKSCPVFDGEVKCNWREM